MKQEFKNSLYFLLSNIFLFTIFYILNFRIFIICALMMIVNTIIFFVLRKQNAIAHNNLFKNLQNNEKVKNITNKTLNSIDLFSFTNEDIRISNIISKSFLFTNLKVNYFVFININILISFISILKINASFMQVLFYILIFCIVNLLFFFYKNIDLKMLVDFGNIKSAKKIYPFMFLYNKNSKFKDKNIGYFLNALKNILTNDERNYKIMLKKEKFKKALNEIEFFPYEESVIKEETFEIVLDKVHSLSRLVDINDKNLEILDVDEFLLHTNKFVLSLDKLSKMGSDADIEDVTNVILKYANYIDLLIEKIK